MALTDRADLLFKISADSKDASDKFKALKGDVKDLKNETDGAGTGFEKFAAGAGLSASQLNVLSTIASTAVAGITAMAAATVSASVALFRMAQSASEFGSQIFDATEKTGLAAKTLSAMKVAADQSGSSFDEVTNAISKFSVLVGQAVDGSDKAIATLAKFGLEPVKAANDLEAALADAIKQIAAMGTEAQQNAALLELFGKAGKDLLPFIKSFDGDLEALIRRMEELGLTIDDQAARAADEFGDTLDTLQAQTTAFTRSFANEFVPELTRGMNRISSEFSENKDVAAEWGRVVGEIIRGLTVVAESDFGNLIATFANGTAQIIRYTLPLIQILDTLRSIGAADGQALGRAGGSLSPALTGGFGGVTTGGGGGGGRSSARDTSERDAEREAERQRREAERIERDRVQAAQQSYQDETAFFEAEADKRLAVLRAYADIQKASAEDIARFEEFLALDTLEFRKRKLQEYIGELVAGTDAQKRALQDLRILDERIETQKAENTAKDNERRKKQTEDEKKLHEDRKRSWKEHIEYLMKVDELAEKEEQRRIAEEAYNARRLAESQMATAPGTIGGGIAGALGVDLVSIFGENNELLSEADFTKAVFADLASSIGESIGQIVSGLAQMTAAWISGSDFSVKALLKMSAAVAMNLAFQAAMKAIFNTAEGFARLAVGDAAGAALHFTAAKIYGTVAAVAGAAGVGLGLAARAVGEGGGASAGRGSSRFAGDADDRQQLNNDYRSRFQGFGGEAGQSPFAAPLNAIKDRLDRQEAVLGGLFETNRLLSVRLTSMRPGDVLAIGADENPSAIRKGIESELGTDLRASESMHRLQGAY